MADGSIKKKLNINWEAVTALATVGATLVGIFGIMLLRGELRELRRANEYTERALKQSYRPFGVIRFRHEDPTFVKVQYAEGSHPDFFSLRCEQEIKNVGQGVLMFLGFFSHLNTVDLDFRKMFLEGAISDISRDIAPNYARGQLLLQGESEKIFISWEDLAYLPKYYQYTIYLYKDQDGNLYDTEHCDVFSFGQPYYEKGKKRPKITESSAARESYYYYPEKEKKLLIKRLKEFKHPMAEVLEKH